MKSKESISDRHIFALYAERSLTLLSSRHVGQLCSIRDQDLWHRIAHVLRARPGDEFVFFDDQKVLQIKLQSLTTKGTVEGIMQQLWEAQPLEPTINLFMGLLRREAWSDVVYYAAQMGVTTITPLISAKTQREWGGQRELERMKSVMIAACEQAHQFVIPQINQPLAFDEALRHHALASSASTASVYGHVEGSAFLSTLQTIVTRHPTTLNIIIGPEGGFTDSESTALEQAGAIGMSLTPTILRSQEAMALCVGAFRSSFFVPDAAQSQNTEI
ncbi:MAG: RsmE family RNA methyltransferase [Candidatus Babeliales bacterium]|jgi:16S rRNA (uracil1498-N3)-methyltransferase